MPTGARAALHRERDEHERLVHGGPTRRPTSRTGSTATSCTAGGRGESREDRARRRGALHRDGRRRRLRSRSAALSDVRPPRRERARRRSATGSTRHEHAPARGRRVLRVGHHPVVARRRCGQRDAAGAGRHALVEAVLQLRRRPLAVRARRRSVQARAARGAAQRSLAPHAERRHHLDAGQVGVPVVCGVGPGVPLSSR